MDYLTKTAAGWWRDFLVAAMFLTRLPLPSAHADADAPPSLGAAARAFPLAGLLIGALGALALMIASKFGWHPVVAVLIALGAIALITGALHEDGLADVADGFGGGRDRTDKLAIMRDSRIGSFGVLALVFAVGLKAAALAGLPGPGVAWAAMAAAAAMSRAVMAPCMAWMHPARTDGLGHGAGRPDALVAAQALGLGAAASVVLLGWGVGLAAVGAAVLAALAVGRVAARRFGGYTGDVLGAAQQAAEVSVLIVVGGMLP
ncbi:MAG: adenosylcobinamide-GDP ribazoletransferase [Proteobacteria bacterium]|nr:adenosylcobinamide-GDP ribazoletransferase [Pseudomonadota bacterium]